jgi:hydroxymethylpyrimidine pyrophosphatase-like HAD family hydrolase
MKKEFKDEINISFTSRYLMEINAIGVNKGTAIEYIAKDEHIKKEQIAAIGDSNNDLAAFNVAKLKIAVKSKSNELIKNADYYLPYKRNAVADAIKSYVLNDNDIYLIASDLDGTLLSNEDKNVVDEAKQAIIKAVNEKNIVFSIASGRGVDDGIKILQDIGFKTFHNLFVVGTNGSCIYDLEKDAYFFTAFIDDKDVINIYNDVLSIINDKHHNGQIALQIFIKGDEHLINAKPQTEY